MNGMTMRAEMKNPGNDHDLEKLLVRAEQQDEAAIQSLMSVHRERLRRMVAVRMHDRLARRIDPSDVIQEAMLDACKKLPDYCKERPLPFYPWLRRFVWQKLVHLQRHHLDAQRRSVGRELPQGMPLSETSSIQLADQLIAGGTSPSNGAVQKESRDKVRSALMQLSNHDREVLVLLYLEQVSIHEASEVLGISQRAANMRHLRALRRIRPVLSNL